MQIRVFLLLISLLMSATLAQAQFIPPPDLPEPNCGLPCATDQDCAEHDVDLFICMQCMPQGVCGNPTCFDSCATNNGCPPECPICSFQTCVAPEADIICQPIAPGEEP